MHRSLPPITARPIGEKLRILDDVRERELAIRGGVPHAESTILRETPVRYRSKPPQPAAAPPRDTPNAGSAAACEWVFVSAVQKAWPCDS